MPIEYFMILIQAVILAVWKSYMQKWQLVYIIQNTLWYVEKVLHCIRDHFNTTIFLKLGDSGGEETQSEISRCSIVLDDEVDVNVKNIIIMRGIGYSKNSKTKVQNSGTRRQTDWSNNATQASSCRRTITLFWNAYHFPANFRPPKAKILFPSHYAWHGHCMNMRMFDEDLERREYITRMRNVSSRVAMCHQTSLE